MTFPAKGSKYFQQIYFKEYNRIKKVWKWFSLS